MSSRVARKSDDESVELWALQMQEAEYTISVERGDIVVALDRFPRVGSWAVGKREHRIGLATVAVDVRERLGPRVGPETLRSIADKLQETVGECDLFVCGSHSPASLRQPYASSDVDLVVFAPTSSLLAEPDSWARWLADCKRLTRTHLQQLAGTPVSIGLLPDEQRCLPGMADCVSLTAPIQADTSGLVIERIRRFVQGEAGLSGPVAGLLRSFGLPLREGITLHVGPRWIDASEFYVDVARVDDLVRSNVLR